MPVPGARATDAAFRTAAIPRTSNAGPPFSAWGDFAGQIHSPERPTGRAPEAGIPPARRGVTGAAIRHVRRTAVPVIDLGLARRAPKAPTIGAIMRMAFLVVLALAAFSLTPTGADAGAWCATYRWGTTNCGYSSSDQCWASVRGIGGFADRIHFPGRPTGRPPATGMRPIRQSAFGAPISKSQRTSAQS